MQCSEAGPGEAAEILSWHAHVYYAGAAEREAAARLRAAIAGRFTVRLGRWHDVPVGPHTRAMYQVAFRPDEFARLVPWLALQRGGLSILVHPNTLAPRADHLAHALWLGDPLPLAASVLPERIDRSAEEEVVPNTQPGSP